MFGMVSNEVISVSWKTPKTSPVSVFLTDTETILKILPLVASVPSMWVKNEAEIPPSNNQNVFILPFTLGI